MVRKMVSKKIFFLLMLTRLLHRKLKRRNNTSVDLNMRISGKANQSLEYSPIVKLKRRVNDYHSFKKRHIILVGPRSPRDNSAVI